MQDKCSRNSSSLSMNLSLFCSISTLLHSRCRTETQLGSCWSVGQPSCLRCKTALKHELSCCCCCCCCLRPALCVSQQKHCRSDPNFLCAKQQLQQQQQQQHAQQQQLPQRCIFYCCCVGNVTAGGQRWQQQKRVGAAGVACWHAKVAT